MAKVTVGTLTSFNHEIQEWSVYKERLEQWFLANEIGVEEDKAGVKRRAILLSNLAESSYKLVRDLALPTQVSTLGYKEVVKLLDGHFKPKKCTFAERFKFHSAVQNAGESLADWAARVRGLATHCGFTALHLDEQLRDRFVLGMEAGPERDKLFTKDISELTLPRALELAEGVRSARMGAQETGQRKDAECLQVMNMAAGGGGGVRPAVARGGRAWQRGASAVGGSQCTVCGYTGHEVNSCRFANYKCKKCGVQGHLKRMCKQRVNRQHYVECCTDGDDDGLQLRSIEEPAGGAGGGVPAPTCYDAECARTEAWLDENQEFVHDYFLRKATRQVVDAWLVSHATPPSAELASPSRAGSGSGATTPVRKISAHEFERGGLLKPLVTTVDGTPTFLGDQPPHATPSRPHRRSRHELRQLDEKELIFELVKDICNELEVRVLCHKILQNVSILLDADRGSLFLVQGEKVASPQPQNGRCLVSKLFDVCSKSTPEQMEQLEEIRIPWGSGIVGYVAESGEPVNIPDAYKDERFNHDIDQQTGYKTRSLLCMPIKDINGEVIGVAQVINKQNDGPFTAYDEKVFASYLQFCGIGLRNAQLYERSQLEVKRNQVLLDLARMVFEEQSTIEHMVLRILTHTQSLIRCQRVQVLLVHEASKGSFSRVFDLEAGDDAEPGTPRTSPYESRFPINIGITGYVATTGETVNIADAYLDARFDPSVDEGTGFKHNTILCMAIKNSEGRIIGVIQLVNKFDDLLFTQNDENFVEAFAIFCGMGIHNTHMYEKAITAMAKQSVTLDVLSYHASASLDDAQRLRTLRIPSSAHFSLHELEFDDIDLTDDDTLRACLRMFLDLDFVERFHIEYSVLCRWLLSVKKNYRNVTYHNWRHAFNVAQMMFAILTETQWWKIFGELECLALIIGCLCHDLDHRGTNNSFQIKASSPLAQLYSTSTMEHHHFDQCLMILNSPGNQILANLSSEDYERVVKVLEDAILSTDLAVYFRKRIPFIELVENERAVTPSWGECEERRGLLRAMLMTACDLAAITKPWPVERRVAALVAGEFFRQGDLERQNLNLTPIDLMNRDKEDELPAMQVKFIDSICLPIYEAFAVLSPALQSMLDRVKTNRAHWIDMANNGEKIDYSLEKETHEKNDKSSLSSQNVDDTENTYEGDSSGASGAVSLSSETNSKYENLENPVVGLLCNNVLAMPREPNKFCQLHDLN